MGASAVNVVATTEPVASGGGIQTPPIALGSVGLGTGWQDFSTSGVEAPQRFELGAAAQPPTPASAADIVEVWASDDASGASSYTNFGQADQVPPAGQRIATLTGPNALCLLPPGELKSRYYNFVRISGTTAGVSLYATSEADSSQGSAAQGLSLYGDGSDGDVLLTPAAGEAGYTTLTRDMVYHSLTLAPGGVTLFTNNFRIYCQTTIVNNGTITVRTDVNQNGGNANGADGGTGGVPRASGSLQGGTAGGDHGHPGKPGAAGTGFGGVGGAGGSSGPIPGGAGGALTAPPEGGRSLRDESSKEPASSLG